MEIDIYKLRKDLIKYYEEILFLGGYGAALFDITNVEQASPEELINIALNNNFNINNYIINNKDYKQKRFNR